MTAAAAGKPLQFRGVVGTPQDVCQLKAACDESDDRTIGRLLGYPDCCREFFKRVWVDEGMVDTTWPVAVATAGANFGGAGRPAPNGVGIHKLSANGKARTFGARWIAV
jgi:hypothetical protein